MDRDLRELERQAVAGSPDAEQRLHAARLRSGIASSYRPVQSSGGKVITNLIGVRVWKEKHDSIISGQIVAIYTPDVAVAAYNIKKSHYDGSTKTVRGELRFVVETDLGSFVEGGANGWSTLKHPKTPDELKKHLLTSSR